MYVRCCFWWVFFPPSSFSLSFCGVASLSLVRYSLLELFFSSFILVAHSLIHSFAHTFTRITLVRKKSFRYVLLHINTHFICVWICRANTNRRAFAFLVRSFHTLSSRSYSTLYSFFTKLFSVCYFALISFRAVCLLYLLFIFVRSFSRFSHKRVFSKTQRNW